MHRLSVIVPVLNEARIIVTALEALQPLRRRGHEVLVVDGGSSDATPELAHPYADAVIRSPGGRARQMNAGAEHASGQLLLFLHADTRLPTGADALIDAALGGEMPGWGRFDIRLDGPQPVLRIIEWMMNRRSRFTGIATGDQCIFVTRDLFRRVGGYPDIDLMEDVAISRLLRQIRSPAYPGSYAVTSSRRWEQKGFTHTILLMWVLRAAYRLGMPPSRLARLYGALD